MNVVIPIKNNSGVDVTLDASISQGKWSGNVPKSIASQTSATLQAANVSNNYFAVNWIDTALHAFVYSYACNSQVPPGTVISGRLTLSAAGKGGSCAVAFNFGDGAADFSGHGNIQGMAFNIEPASVVGSTMTGKITISDAGKK